MKFFCLISQNNISLQILILCLWTTKLSHADGHHGCVDKAMHVLIFTIQEIDEEAPYNSSIGQKLLASFIVVENSSWNFKKILCMKDQLNTFIFVKSGTVWGIKIVEMVELYAFEKLLILARTPQEEKKNGYMDILVKN